MSAIIDPQGPFSEPTGDHPDSWGEVPGPNADALTLCAWYGVNYARIYRAIELHPAVSFHEATEWALRNAGRWSTVADDKPSLDALSAAFAREFARRDRMGFGDAKIGEAA